MSMYDKYVRPAYDQGRSMREEELTLMGPELPVQQPRPRDPITDIIGKIMTGMADQNAKMHKALQHIAFLAEEEALDPLQRLGRIKIMAEEALKKPDPDKDGAI